MACQVIWPTYWFVSIFVCVCVWVCYVVAIAGDTSKHNILKSAQGDLEVGAGDVLHLPDLSWPNDCRRHVLAPYATLDGVAIMVHPSSVILLMLIRKRMHDKYNLLL